MVAIDFYSGIGGWTLGFKMAGIEVLASYEWWKDANNTHNKNFGRSHKEIDIRKLSLSDLPKPGTIDFVIGSPPCTQFSLSNRGGKGDIADGLIDIHKFLTIVQYMKPKYWAMENVPRVAGIIEKELKSDGSLHEFAHLFGDIKVYNSSDFGVPQDRKRMIAGNLPFDLLESYKTKIRKTTLGDVIQSLNGIKIVDPVYKIELDRALLSDHILESNLNREELRINQETKTHHPVYNKMSFPDKQDRPSRTVTALCTRVSRESIIVEDNYGNIRRLTIRERACLQSFPITYQFFDSTYANKIKMIGNSIPPLLTFYIAQSMQGIKVTNVKNPTQVKDLIILSNDISKSTKPDKEGKRYSWNRSFWLAIRELRFGSGVRFELKNYHNKPDKSTTWKINFFYGNSKNIKGKELDDLLLAEAIKVGKLMKDEILKGILSSYTSFLNQIELTDLQENWSNKNKELYNPIDLIDEISFYAKEMIDYLNTKPEYKNSIQDFIVEKFEKSDGKYDNKKLLLSSIEVYVGLLLGSKFNVIFTKKEKLSLRPTLFDQMA